MEIIKVTHKKQRKKTMKKSIYTLLIATLTMTTAAITAMYNPPLPIYIKNNTNYTLSIVINGITNSPITLKEQQLIPINAGGRFANLLLEDFNRLQIKNLSGYYTSHADIRKENLAPIKQSFIKHYQHYIPIGYVPCFYINATMTGWEIKGIWIKQ